MVGFSETDWAIIASIAAPAVAALVHNPRALQVGMIQRRKWIQVLIRLSPTVRGFYANLPVPSNLGRATFVGATISIMIAAVAIKLLVTDPFYFSIAAFLLFLVPQLVGKRVALSYAQGLYIAQDQTRSSGVVTERNWRLPGVIRRAFISMLISDIFSGLLVLTNLGAYTSLSAWFPVALYLIFAPLYLVQMIDFLIITEDLLFRSCLALSKASVLVVVHVAGGGSVDSDTVRGNLVGIGTNCQLQRDDGYIEEIGWEAIWRLAIKP